MASARAVAMNVGHPDQGRRAARTTTSLRANQINRDADATVISFRIFPGAASTTLLYAANSSVGIAFRASSPSIGGLARKFWSLASTATALIRPRFHSSSGAKSSTSKNSPVSSSRSYADPMEAFRKGMISLS